MSSLAIEGIQYLTFVIHFFKELRTSKPAALPYTLHWQKATIHYQWAFQAKKAVATLLTKSLINQKINQNENANNRRNGPDLRIRPMRPYSNRRRASC
jgi:hypothetical protein